MKPRFKLILLLLFILCNCIAQNKFKYQTFTDSVVKDGFYQINLLPSIVAKSKHTLDDIRLLDENNKQVPYLIKNGEITFEQNEFISFKKISEITDTNSIIKILIENTNKITIDNLALILKSTLADRSVNISGSDDAKNWYIIKEFINLEMTNNIDDKHFVQSISLPLVDYKFFKIVFNGKQHDPMFIEQVGTYKTRKQLKNYFIILDPPIKQHDSTNKLSYLKLVFKEPYKIDKIQLFASGSIFYERNIVFEEGYYNADKNYKTGVISSKSNNIFFLNLFVDNNKSDTLKFTIQNDDNPPLKIDSVKAYQKAYALFAYLKAGQKYKLAFGNDSLSAPVYDISAFSDSIKNAILLPTNEITENQFAIKQTTKATDSFNNKIWLWTAIITVLLILLYFTSTMLKQINKRG